MTPIVCLTLFGIVFICAVAVIVALYLNCCFERQIKMFRNPDYDKLVEKQFSERICDLEEKVVEMQKQLSSYKNNSENTADNNKHSNDTHNAVK